MSQFKNQLQHFIFTNFLVIIIIIQVRAMVQPYFFLFLNAICNLFNSSFQLRSSHVQNKQVDFLTLNLRFGPRDQTSICLCRWEKKRLPNLKIIGFKFRKWIWWQTDLKTLQGQYWPTFRFQLLQSRMVCNISLTILIWSI